MNGYLRKSLRRKIAAAVLAAVMVTTMLTALVGAWLEAERRFDAKQEALHGTAVAIAASLAAPLADGNRNRVALALNAIRAIPSISYVLVMDANGRRVHEIGSGVVLGSADERLQANRDIGVLTTIKLGTYLLSVPVVSGGRNVGDLVLIADVSALRKALLLSLVQALATGLLGAGIAILLSSRLRENIARPIVALTEAADAACQNADYSQPVARTSEDEAGRLVDSFNAMMAEIRIRDRELRKQRDSLAAQVVERTRELADAKDAAERANAAKSEFLATMSHEIRTPMNGMLVMAELMAADELSPKTRRQCDTIVRSGQLLLALINDILDLSKIEAGHLQLESIPLEPRTVVEDVLKLFADRAASSNLELACFVAPNVPRLVMGDPLRLSQIVSNLVSNALKFTEKGGILVTATMAEGVEPSLRIAVRDTGIGIPDDKLPVLFEAFTQAEQSTSRRFGGTGIGLTICRRLVGAMGGTIAVESTVGSGSTFSFVIPVARVASAPEVVSEKVPDGAVAIVLPPGPVCDALTMIVSSLGLRLEDDAPDASLRLVIADAVALLEDPQALEGIDAPVLVVGGAGEVSATRLVRAGLAAGVIDPPVGGDATLDTIRRVLSGELLAEPTAGTAKAAPASLARETFAGARVLAADDSIVNREVLAEALQRLGVEVVSVASGIEAIAALESERFDLVFMDGSMPEMDGFEATRRIRRRERETGRPSVPVIALTAHVMGEQARAWRDAGMNDHVAKPFTLATIRQCLQRWIVPRDARPALAAVGATAQAVPASGSTDGLLDREVLDSILELQAPGDDLVVRVIGLYCEHAPRLLDGIGAAVPAGGEHLATAAHALKSLCRNIGAIVAGDLCETIESEARAGRVARTALADLPDMVEATIAALQQERQRLTRVGTPERVA